LTSQVPDRCAPFRVAHASRAFAEAGCKVTQKSRERSDFVLTSAEFHVETIEVQYRSLRGKVGERFADAGGQPHAQKKRGDSSAHGGHQKQIVHAALEIAKRCKGLGYLQLRGYNLERRLWSLLYQGNLPRADSSIGGAGLS